MNVQEISDRLEIIDVMSNYAASLDARDWELWRSIFVDELIFDLSAWNGIEPRPLDTNRVVAGQARTFAEFAVTQHFITNHRITLDGDKARVVAHMRAEHWLEGGSGPAGASAGEGTLRYTMFGYYDDDLVRTEDGRKICKMQLNVTGTEGNRWVMEEATRRARKTRQ